MASNEHRARSRELVSAYQEASKRLRHSHPEEFKGLLAEVYAQRGITMRRRGRPRKQTETPDAQQ